MYFLIDFIFILVLQRMSLPFLPIAPVERVVEGVEGFRYLMVYGSWSCIFYFPCQTELWHFEI